MTEASVLVVEYDAEERGRMSAWLESDGFNVLVCPGPKEPDYTCLGGRGLPCPLAQEADVVVLDLQLASDEMLTGTASWELLVYYMQNGRRIVALSADGDSVHPLPDDQVAVIRRPTDREALLAAVRELVLRASGEGGNRRGEDPAR